MIQTESVSGFWIQGSVIIEQKKTGATLEYRIQGSSHDTGYRGYIKIQYTWTTTITNSGY